MGKPKLEQRKHGLALVTDARLAPFGYVRDGRLHMESGGDAVEFSPEDLERLAKEIREARVTQPWRVAHHARTSLT